MNRACTIAALLAALAPATCLAQSHPKSKPAEKWNVEVKMADGRSFKGVIELDAVEVHGDFGQYAIRPEKIKHVRFPGQDHGQLIAEPGGFQVRGTLLTDADEQFDGTVIFPHKGIETDLGTLRPNPVKIRSLTFKGRAVTVTSTPAPGEPDLAPAGTGR